MASARALAARPRRILLVGTPGTLGQLQRMLADTRPADPVTVVGALSTSAGPVAHVDHDPAPLPTLGSPDELEAVIAAHAVDRILLCLPEAMHPLAADVERRAAAAGVALRRIPTFAELLDQPPPVPCSVFDADRLLDRPRHALDESAIAGVLTGRRVLITGAGGSIGAELARRVARFRPASLLLMDRSENALFEIDRVVAQRHPRVSRRTLLHDVAEADRTRDLLLTHRPDVVFHAAAHKHVPMMEDHPAAAIVNNFFGTRAVADAARAAGVERFVMISTDKAVNPASVMGATKRAAELYVQHVAGGGDARSAGRFSIVRFGNVLGSACSVVPTWSRQLAVGGPLTLTDRRMTRYFMTIGEAAALVLQAATLGPGNDGPAPHPAATFLLDMGEPIRIVDLADRFIRLHGLEPGRDVDIAFTGIRQGEKLHEQLVYDGESIRRTAHPAIRLLRTGQPDPHEIQRLIQTLHALRTADDVCTLRTTLRDALRQANPSVTAAPSALAAPV